MIHANQLPCLDKSNFMMPFTRNMTRQITPSVKVVGIYHALVFKFITNHLNGKAAIYQFEH